MKQDISNPHGDTLTLNFTLTSNDVAVDITGWKVFSTIKNERTDSDSAALATSDSTSFSNPTGGVGAVTYTATVMNTIPVGSYYYDLRFKKPDGTIFTAIYGRLVIEFHATYRIS